MNQQIQLFYVVPTTKSPRNYWGEAMCDNYHPNDILGDTQQETCARDAVPQSMLWL